MDVKEFISTGILESYLLGTASPSEIDAVHQMLAAHPYLKIEIDALEETLLEVAHSKKQTLSNNLKEKIFTSINFEQARTQPLDQKKSLPLQSVNKNKVLLPSYLRYGMVASVALLVISGLLNMNLLYKNNQAQNQWSQMVKQRVHLEVELADQKKMVDEMSTQIEALSNLETKTIVLKGNNGSLAHVYWNKRSKKTYFRVSDLPAPPPDQQYQLWAMVDGTPMDAGLLITGGPQILQNMKFIDTPESFAITLEKKGGSPTPTLANMVLFGEV
jgi:anti-sigma-K factor RskA